MKTKDRLKLFVKSLNMGQNIFEKEVGIANGYLASKSQTISSDTVERVIEKYPNLNLEWLFRGDGEMLWEKPSLPLTSEREFIYKELFERKERELAESRKRIEELIAHNAKLEQELTVFTMKKTDVQEAESASDAAIKLKPTGTDDL